MLTKQSQYLGLLVLVSNMVLAFGLWWLIKPFFEPLLFRVPGTAGVLAVGIGLWVLLGLFLMVSLRLSLEIAHRWLTSSSDHN